MNLPPSRFARKPLAAALSLSLASAAPGGSIWAQTVVNSAAEGASVVGAAGAAGGQALQLRAGAPAGPGLASPSAGLSLGPSSIVTAPMARRVETRAVLGSGTPASAVPAAVERHPVIGIINKIQEAGAVLPTKLSSPADAAKLQAVIRALPAGPARDNLAAFADAVSFRGGAREGLLNRTFENSLVAKFQGVEAVPAAKAAEPAGFWAFVSRLAPSRLGKFAAKRAEAARPKVPPVSPTAYRVPIEKLRWVPKEKDLPASIASLPETDKQIVGQEKGLAALEWALQMPGDRYNVIVSGPEGTGRTPATLHILSDVAPKLPTPPDLVAVTNFDDKDEPIVLELAPGAAEAFKEAVGGFLKALRFGLPKALVSGPAAEKKQAVQDKVDAKAAEWEAKVDAVRLVGGRFGMAMLPKQKADGGLVFVTFLIFDGQKVAKGEEEEYIARNRFTRAEWEQGMSEMREKAGSLKDDFIETARAVQLARGKAEREMERIEKEAAAAFVEERGRGLRKLVAPEGVQPVSKAARTALAYVDKLLERASKNYAMFLPRNASADPAAGGPRVRGRRELEKAFKVSVLASNRPGSGAPVVYESDPTAENLFGKTDDEIIVWQGRQVKLKDKGGPTLKPGSAIKANGGFLVVKLMDVLRDEASWRGLMKLVRTGKAEIVEDGARGMARSRGDSYEVPVKLKLVLIASPLLKMLLEHYDEDFQKYFKAAVEFDSVMDITAAGIGGYLDFLRKMFGKFAGEVLNLDRGAISEILQQGARDAESNEKLSTVFGPILDFYKEASHWARKAGRDIVRGEDARRAQDAKREREGLTQRHMIELYGKDIFHVQTEGAAVGQINALTVYGDFGLPARTTATMSPAGGGASGVEDLDDLVGWAGQSYKAGVEDVKSFILSTFASGGKRFPALLRVKKEQMYGGIDGDSSTSTKMYALLSRLSGVAIKQGIAVTGSADQFGNVQAIGGVNLKIEGYFDLLKYKLKRRGKEFDGSQGVVIPATNVADLQLRPDVVEAIRRGKFHVWAVKHVSQGAEILMGEAYSEILRKAKANLEAMRP